MTWARAQSVAAITHLCSGSSRRSDLAIERGVAATSDAISETASIVPRRSRPHCSIHRIDDDASQPKWMRERSDQIAGGVENFNSRVAG